MTDYATPQKHALHQADATLDQDNPVSTTWYTILDTVYLARIISIAANVTWTVQPSPLEVRVTIDGQTLLAPKTDPATATTYSMGNSDPLIANWDLGDFFPEDMAFLLEGKSIKVEVRTTGGTTSNLKGRVRYALLR